MCAVNDNVHVGNHDVHFGYCGVNIGSACHLYKTNILNMVTDV